MTALSRFWFATSRRYSMGIFRIILGAWFLLDFAGFLPALDEIARRPAALMSPCAGLRWSGLSQADPAALVALLRPAAWVLAAAATLGAGTRFALLALALVNAILRSLHNSWGYVGHASILPAFTLFILAFSPGAADWSLDALLGWLAARLRGAARPLLDRLAGRPAAVWPVHLVLMLVAVVYFAAGCEKIREGGRSWLDGRTLQWYLEGRAHSKRLGDSTQFFSARRDTPTDRLFRDPWGLDKVCNSAPATATGKRVAGSRALCAVLSWATLFLECGFFLVFFLPRRLQYVLFLLLAAFHGGIGHMMRIDFGGYVVLYLCAVDWNAVVRALDSFLPGVGRARESS
ncbi:MAG: hypothetical protein HYY18_04290 [Planctomycetes bacterium]|nr:hypothetical protein [Planctomycetota bacterium]